MTRVVYRNAAVLGAVVLLVVSLQVAATPGDAGRSDPNEASASGGAVDPTVDKGSIPEPFTMLLLAAGAPLLLSRRRRQAGL